MLRMIYYELQKVWINKLICLVVVGFLFLNVFNFLVEEQQHFKANPEWQALYESMKIEYEALPLEEAVEQLTRQMEYESQFHIWESILATEDKQWMEDFTKENPELVEAYDVFIKEGGFGSPMESGIRYTMLEELNYLLQYDDYILGMETQANTMLQVSIFNQPGTFSYRNVIKTPVDFEHHLGLELSLDSSRAVVAATDYELTDLLVLFFLFLVAIRLFWQEKEQSLYFLIGTTKEGKGSTIAAKILGISLITIGAVLLFYGSIVLLSGGIYGYGDLTRPIQSMREFSNALYLLSVGEYLLVFLLGKMMAVLVIVLLFCLVLSVSSNQGFALLVIFLLLGSSYLGYRLIPYLSYLNGLKFLNPVAGLDVFEWLSNYQNINVFGYPVERVLSLLLVALILLGGSIALICYSYLTGRLQIKLGWYQGICYWFHRKLEGLQTTCLWLQEVVKLLFIKKMILVYALLALFISMSVVETEPVYLLEEDVYLEYFAQVEGPLTEESKVFMAEEREKFDRVAEEMGTWIEAYEVGEIDAEKLEYELYLLESFSKRDKGFLRLEQQYFSLLSLEGKVDNLGFVSIVSSEYLWGERLRDEVQQLLFFALLIVVVGTCYGQEYKKRIYFLLLPTIKGREILARRKYSICTVLMLSFLVLFLPVYWNASLWYPLGDVGLAIQSVSYFMDFPLELTILQYILGSSLVFVLVSLGVIAGIGILAEKIKNQMLTMLLVFALVALPILIL